MLSIVDGNSRVLKKKNMFSCTHFQQGLVPEYAPECSIVLYSNPKQIVMGLH